MAKVLLIEDDNNLREIFEMRLQAEGYQTVTASNGEEGITVAMAEKPDLIITDVMMPKLSGFEMLENLRQAPEMKNIKAIMMTALGQDDDRAKGEKLGVVKYLVKSQVTLEDFAREVRTVLPPEGGGGASTDTGSQANNKKESESKMPEDTNATNPPADNGAGTNPISGGAPADAVGGSGQMSSAQEQGAVADQINNFAGAAPASDSTTPAAPAEDVSAAPASDAPAADAGVSAVPADDAGAADESIPAAGDSVAPSDPAGGEGSTDAPAMPPSSEPPQTPPQPPTAAPGSDPTNAI